jgi:hypothetical protein
VRKDETLALGDAAENTRRISAKVKHRDRLYHVFNFNLKFNMEQGQNEAADSFPAFAQPIPTCSLTNRERDSLANDGQIEPNRRKWPLDD